MPTEFSRLKLFRWPNTWHNLIETQLPLAYTMSDLPATTKRKPIYSRRRRMLVGEHQEAGNHEIARLSDSGPLLWSGGSGSSGDRSSEQGSG